MTHPLPDEAAERPDPLATDALAALRARLHAAQLGCYATLNGCAPTPFPIIPHNELALLNADLAEVRRLNAALYGQQRSARIAALPEPAFALRRLHGHSDVLPAIESALSVLSAVEANAAAWRPAHVPA